MNVASVLSGLARVGGRAAEGYAIDEAGRVRAALAQRKQAQDDESSRVLNALTQARTNQITNPAPAPPPKPERQVVNGQVVNLDAATATPIADYKPPEPPAPNLNFQTLGGAGGEPPKIVALDPKTGEQVREIGAAKATGGGGLSGAALKTAIAENRTQMQAIDNAITSLTANPTATGLRRGLGAIPGMGKIGEIVNQKTDAEGNPTRDMLGRISSVVIKDISGANVTGPEWSRLGWVPDASYDHARNLEKLKAMRDFAETKTKEMERALGGSGPATGATAGDAEFDALMASLKKKTP